MLTDHLVHGHDLARCAPIQTRNDSLVGQIAQNVGNGYVVARAVHVGTISVVRTLPTSRDFHCTRSEWHAACLGSDDQHQTRFRDCTQLQLAPPPFHDAGTRVPRVATAAASAMFRQHEHSALESAGYVSHTRPQPSFPRNGLTWMLGTKPHASSPRSCVVSSHPQLPRKKITRCIA